MATSGQRIPTKPHRRRRGRVYHGGEFNVTPASPQQRKRDFSVQYFRQYTKVVIFYAFSFKTPIQAPKTGGLEAPHPLNGGQSLRNPQEVGYLAATKLVIRPVSSSSSSSSQTFSKWPKQGKLLQ